MNADALDPRLFWPAFVLVWFILGVAVALLFGRIVDLSNPRNRYEGDDDVADRKRRLERNGFKSKQGIK
jgi:hypothetical protein